MLKKAYSISMTYDISNEEKRYAEQALLNFEGASKLLDLASDYLNLIKNPFKDAQPSSSEEILENRVALRRYRDKSVKNFNDFKLKSFSCINGMNRFSSDTQSGKLMKSFISSIEELEEFVNIFIALFEDLKNQEFQSLVVKNCDKIQEKCKDIKEIIEDRIVNHIRTNILARNWVDGVSDTIQQKVDKTLPLMLEVQKQEQNQLNKEITK